MESPDAQERWEEEQVRKLRGRPVSITFREKDIAMWLRNQSRGWVVNHIGNCILEKYEKLSSDQETDS